MHQQLNETDPQYYISQCKIPVDNIQTANRTPAWQWIDEEEELPAWPSLSVLRVQSVPAELLSVENMQTLLCLVFLDSVIYRNSHQSILEFMLIHFCSIIILIRYLYFRVDFIISPLKEVSVIKPCLRHLQNTYFCRQK